MFSAIRKRLSYINVALTLGLVFVMSGCTYAANHYLITSTKQISPKVLKVLTGKPGNNGAPGTAGAPGSVGPAGAKGEVGSPGGEGPRGKEGKAGKAGREGEEGKEGKEGKEGSPWTSGGTLPKGSTEMGTWSVSANATVANQRLSVPISFTIPLRAAPTAVHFISSEESTPAGCVGNVKEPGADSGNLCVFQNEAAQLNAVEWKFKVFSFERPERFYNPQSGSQPPGEAAGTAGATLLVGSEGAGEVFANGSWAVTAE